ncbi:cytochrome c [uncultured Roseibium sp.]|uniref:c-type cytochrome n=1 Tax=uncultured Roseibium sp. TaxID=1936171 RepID=UPI00262979C6|nr:cytochrome c [uncultured Roseibium sp.]
MNLRRLLIVPFLLSVTVALAHEGVKNAAVQARMDSMSEIAKSMKLLGNMAKGAAPFDAKAANSATAIIANEASKTASLFEAQETDPKSEAKPEIWTNFEDFNRKAADMERVALEFSNSISDLERLKTATNLIGQTCKSCHAEFRK